MIKNPILSQLSSIKNRYFRPVIANKDGIIVHYADCDIYQAKEIYGFAPCTCGLLHDLNWIDFRLAEKIYPNFGTELTKSEMTWEEEKNWVPSSKEDIDKFFEDNGIVVHNIEDVQQELKEEDKEHWSIIEKIFGYKYVTYLKSLIDTN